ncbi:YesL family protein [Saliterribacillus persicus]|uniref:Putative membrane protein YesL n=1 Tax=Saliterribacillus persicus TaxID=930114 RepID=A0A368XAJ8_9BACI|nr:YesL family protein [Saliterribacillus persicus]RCW64256.1 putative membrane protein YesL [Saliterribacillus persicus]
MRQSLFGMTEWVTRFAYVNILWLAFTLLGLVLFGFFPATIAMNAMIRQWLLGNTDEPVFKFFWTTYKQEFIKGNLLGLTLVLIALLFYVDLQFIQMNQGGVFDIIQIPIYLFMLAITLTAFYVIPTYVHFNLSIWGIWKNSFLVMLIHPFHNIGMVLGAFVILYIQYIIPGTFFFFGGSMIAFVIMGTCLQAFQKVEKKQKAQREENGTDNLEK